MTSASAPEAQATALPSTTDRYWMTLILRSIPALGAGLGVTFWQDHSTSIGLIAFGVLAASTGLVQLAGAFTTMTAGTDRAITVALGLISAAAGIAALISLGSSVATLLLILTMWAVLTGGLELYLGVRNKRVGVARDWLSLGILTLLAALIFAIIAPDAGLTTGLLGGYALLVGVFLAIAGMSLKWAGPDLQHRKVAA